MIDNKHVKIRVKHNFAGSSDEDTTQLGQHAAGSIIRTYGLASALQPFDVS